MKRIQQMILPIIDGNMDLAPYLTGSAGAAGRRDQRVGGSGVVLCGSAESIAGTMADSAETMRSLAVWTRPAIFI